MTQDIEVDNNQGREEETRRRRPSSTTPRGACFEQARFTYIRSKGMHHSVMRKTVPATRATSTRRRTKR